MNLDEIVAVADAQKALQHQDIAPAKPLWERLVSLGQEVPEEEWAKLPTDLSRNFEHYTYGSPKE
jgi:hypothetical protein